MLFEFPRLTGARWCVLELLPVCVAWLLPACLVDLDERCGPHQRYDAERAVCSCEVQFALAGNRCVPCGENEVGSPDGCLCAEGYVRTTPEAPCQALVGLGRDCQSDAECGEPSYGRCRIDAGVEVGYCTAADCQSSSDCPGDYSCNTREAPSFCERPPSGLGQPCSSSDDCAGNTASYCETVVAGSCVVNDCAPDPSKCYGDWVCCDIGLLSQSLCVPPSELENGKCPAGGTLIAPEGG
jgi:hypothetical protein